MANTPYYTKAEADSLNQQIKRQFGTGIIGTVSPNVGGVPQINGGNITENGFYYIGEDGDYGTETGITLTDKIVLLEVKDIETTAIYDTIEYSITLTIDATPTPESTHVVQSGGVAAYIDLINVKPISFSTIANFTENYTGGILTVSWDSEMIVNFSDGSYSIIPSGSVDITANNNSIYFEKPVGNNATQTLSEKTISEDIRNSDTLFTCLLFTRKTNTLSFNAFNKDIKDAVPTSGSKKNVESDGVKQAIDTVQSNVDTVDERVVSLENDIITLSKTKNIFDISNFKDNHYVKYNDGVHVYNEDFIIVTVDNLEPNTDYVFSNQGVINPSGVSNLQQMAFLNANGDYISGDIGGVNEVTFNTSATIVSVEFTIAKSRIDYEYQLEEGTTRGYYVPFSKTINTSYLNPSLQKMLTDLNKEVVTFSVDDYSKNYTNLREALESCTDVTKFYEVWLYSSVSNVLTEYFTEVEINDVAFKGLDIPNNVTLVNPDLTTEITLGGFLDTGTYDSTTRNRVSTLNFIYNGGLKGIKVTGENVRYAVHDDIGSDKVDAIRLVEDCEFVKIGTDGFTQAYGAGTRSGMIMTIKRSKFFTDDEGAVFSCHNNTGFTKKSKVVLEDNHFRSVKGYNSVAFGSINSATEDEIVMIGNNLNNGILLKEEGAGVGNGIDYKLTGYGNTKVPVFIEHTDVAQYTYDFNEDVESYRNRAGSTISKGTLVRLNFTGSGGIFAMSSSTPNQEYGIAFEDIPTLELGKVKPFKSGQWIAISDTDLTGTSIGDKIGIDANGDLEITTGTDYIGVVLLNDFIRLK